MLVESPGACTYLLNVLEAAPDVFDYLLRELSQGEADFCPDPTRFTIREVMAHLADWDEIFFARIEQTRDDHEPTLEEYDTTQRGLDLGYERTKLEEQRGLFRQRRTRMVEFLRLLSLEDWQRFCVHPRVGRITMEALVTLVTLHDGYHLRQIVEWKRSFEDKCF